MCGSPMDEFLASLGPKWETYKERFEGCSVDVSARLTTETLKELMKNEKRFMETDVLVLRDNLQPYRAGKHLRADD